MTSKKSTVFCAQILLGVLAILAPWSSAAAEIRLGADQILAEPYFDWIKGRRVGLITNQTGTTSDLRYLFDVLQRHPDVRLVALFSPEHGIFGEAQAGQEVSNSANIYSLYGETRAPTDEMLEDVDILLYDIQDVGVRFYTFISTMLESMKAASKRGIPFVVLDRPNPIDGSRVEGPVLEQGRESFVGIHTMPIRYGMTAGEVARLMRAETGLKLDLRIVPVKGWKRDSWFDDNALFWIAPSPNMPTLTTATLYPGLCLIEGTNLSEGRGTTRPFELVGAPWLDAGEIVRRLEALQLPGVRFRVQPFTPTFSKYRDESCQGLQIHISDRAQFDPLKTALHLIREVILVHPGRFEFRESSMDRLAGNSWIRESLSQGVPVEEIIRRWQADLAQFKLRRLQHVIY